jgi:enoyl-CoA hydratase
MDYRYLLLTKEGGIGTVTLNRPEVLNALNKTVFSELSGLFAEIERDPEVRVVILTGAGDRAFAAGVDIKEMKDEDSAGIREFVAIARQAGDRIYNLPKPVIAVVNGFAFGGGHELALACDLRIASENAKFGQQEINLGIIPGGGAIPRLTQMAGLARAREICYTGDVFDAATALALGIVNRVVPQDRLMAEAGELARKLLTKSGAALAAAKRAFNEGLDLTLPEALDLDEDLFAACFDTEDQKEGMQAFIDRRPADFKHR